MATKKHHSKALLSLVLLLTLFAFSGHASASPRIQQAVRTESPIPAALKSHGRKIITFTKFFNQGVDTSGDVVQSFTNEILLFHNRFYELQFQIGARKFLSISHLVRLSKMNSQTPHVAEEYSLKTFMG